MIRVCPTCSNINSDNLKNIIALDEIEEGCIGECSKHEGKYFGYIEDKLVIKDSEEDFIQEVKLSSSK
ncbi:DUF1450 domain-containing protein [Clostridium sp.]|uniref:DUF1450 domain-containing protein n=1 Tax=Clostridium sp. TaxID=1506 RepID=UPI002FC91A6C